MQQANFNFTVPPILSAIRYRRNRKARRYILRLNSEGVAWVTIPRGGSESAARQFVGKHTAWLEGQLLKFRARAEKPVGQDGILFQGERVEIVAESETRVSFAGHAMEIGPDGNSLRRRLREKLWGLAWEDLPPRVLALAARHGVTVKRVSVRNQRTRWGSCSTRGVISLNWRLIQAPEFVREYIIVHELMHLRQMNHSARFWRLVTEAFPQTDLAEQWLKAHDGLLREL